MSEEGRGQLPTWWRGRDARAEEVGKIAGRKMSDRTLRRISFVIGHGCPELVAAMNAGRISIAAAAELARLPAEMQIRFINNRALRRVVVRIIREDAKTPTSIDEDMGQGWTGATGAAMSHRGD